MLPPTPKAELEVYAYKYFKYTKLFQDQTDMMRNNPREMNAAYKRVAEESRLDLQMSTDAGLKTLEEAHQILARYERQCEVTPQNYDELSISMNLIYMR